MIERVITKYQDFFLSGSGYEGREERLIRDAQLTLHFLKREVEEACNGKLFLAFVRWQSSYLQAIKISLDDYIHLLLTFAETIRQGPGSMDPEATHELLTGVKKALQVKRYESGMKLRSIFDDIHVENIFEAHLRLFPDQDPSTFTRSLSDLLEILQEAVDHKSEPLFLNYLCRLKKTILASSSDQNQLQYLLISVRLELLNRLAGRLRKPALQFLDAGIVLLEKGEETGENLVEEAQGIDRECSWKYIRFLLDRNTHEAEKLIQDQLEEGGSLRSVYLDTLWQSNEFFRKEVREGRFSVVQQRYFAQQTRTILSRLAPLFPTQPSLDKSMIAVSAGEEWPGLRLKMMTELFQIEGWEGFYLGGEVSPVVLLTALKEWKPQLLLLAVPTSMDVSRAQRLITTLRNSEYPNVYVLVTGDPLREDPTLWSRIGADGMANHPQEAIQVVQA